MNYRKFLIAALLVMSFSVQAKDITVTRLTCEMREGRVTTSDAPRLGWQMSSPENGTRQTAYEDRDSGCMGRKSSLEQR